MHILIIIIHLFVCFALIGIVLLQTGKGASMGAMFGGAGNQTLFGNTGASTFLSKATTAAAVVFMLTSLSLAYISKSGDKSVVEEFRPATEQSIPAEQLPAAPGEQTTPGADESGQQMPESNENQPVQ
jgi:preprotein translocase subunit SecG